jgi:hypothetical protein
MKKRAFGGLFCGGRPFHNLCHPRHIRGRGPQPVLAEHSAWEGPRSGGCGKACLRRKGRGDKRLICEELRNLLIYRRNEAKHVNT